MNLAVLCATLVVLALLCEVFLRVSGIQKIVAMNPAIYQADADSEISYRLIPSHVGKGYGATVTTNSLGFRSQELTSDAHPVVLLGDSLVFGYGVKDDQTLGVDLQTLLPKQSVLSAGVSGYNIRQERAVYEKTLKPLQPKALILVFMPNDFDETFKLDAEGYFRPQSDTGSLTYEERLTQQLHQTGQLHIPFKTFLQTHSALFTFLERETKSLPFRTHAAARNVFDDPVTDAQLQAYTTDFTRLTQAAGDIPKMLVIWPEANLHTKTRAFLKPLATQLGYTVVDLYEIYGNSYPSLGWDGHPNAATLQKTAEVIRDAMAVDPKFKSLQ